MTNFLTRLVERTLGLVPTVQPILPTMFAPRPDMESTFDITLEESISDPQNGQAMAGISPASQGAQRSSSPATLHDSIESIQEAGHSRRHPQDIASTMPTKQLHGTATELKSDIPLREGSSGKNLAHSVEPVITISTIMQENVAEIREEHSLQSGKNALNGHAVRSAPSSTSSNQLVSSAQISFTYPEAVVQAPQLGTSEVLPMRTPVDNVTARPGTVRPYIIQQVEQKKEHALDSQAAAPIPTVQVTIGRIEVRAAPPPAAASRLPQQQPTSPVMSLDRYLHQRSKGGH